MVLGSFFLTPATAIRYERHDRKVKQLTEGEKLGIGKDKRQVNIRDEYYVSGVDETLTDGMDVALTLAVRNWQRRTWTTGSKNGCNGCLASRMA